MTLAQSNLKILIPPRSPRAHDAAYLLPGFQHSPRPALYKALARPLLPMVSARIRTRQLIYTDGLSFPATTQIGDFLWSVNLPFVVRLDDGATHYEILIPPGWDTDYGSVPRIFWNIVPPLGIYSAAYVLHDYLYEAELYDRATCDWLLLLALQDLGAWWIERNTIYSAVRTCGWAVWRNHDQEHVKAAKTLQRATQFQIMSADNPYDLAFNTETKRYELKTATITNEVQK